MRYYFHLESETNIHIDHLGRDIADLRGVETHATQLARELANEDRWLGWTVRVIDAHNREVLSVQILDSILSQ